MEWCCRRRISFGGRNRTIPTVRLRACRAGLDNFCDLLEHLPVYVDPWMCWPDGTWCLLNRLRERKLAAGIRLCRVEAGPGAVTESSRGLATTPTLHPTIASVWNWAGAACWTIAPGPASSTVSDKAEFYGAEERVVRAIQGWIRRTVEVDRKLRPGPCETDPTLKKPTSARWPR